MLWRHPDSADNLSRCLVVAQKRKQKKNRTFLESREVNALLKAIDTSTWKGRRDHLMISLALQTGVRVSELVGLKCEDVTLGKYPHITVLGKGRKERSIPLGRTISHHIEHWISSQTDRSPTLFCTIRGTRLSTDAVQYALQKYTRIAQKSSPTLVKKNVTPHTLRHTMAMQMLERGVDIQIIALWLGHEQVETTQIYFSESLAIKRKALKKTRIESKWSPPPSKSTELTFLDEI